MSKTTLHKRIALMATTALVAGMFTVTSVPVASATHPVVGAENQALTATTIGAPNNYLFVATRPNTGAAGTVTATAAAVADIEDGALSKGLLAKDTSSGTAQTATVLAGGQLSLYALVTTTVAFTATGGSFSSTISYVPGVAQYSSNNAITIPGGYSATSGTTASGTATLWTAPSTPGTYTVSMLTGYAYTASSGAYVFPSFTNGLPPTLGAKITVTVVASSAGGSYSAANSACNTAVNTTAESATYPNGIDSSGTVSDGGSWSIDFTLNDAYGANLDPGNLVATATNGALVNFSATDGAGTTPVAGTSSTDVALQNGSNTTLVVSQPTAGAPLTTTVTITYNGTTVCQKTVTIRGKVASLEVSGVGTGSLSSQAGSTIWIEGQAGGVRPAGLFLVLAKDSAGNIVSTPSTLGAYSAVASTLTTVVQSVSVVSPSSSSSSTSENRFNIGTFYCGDTAGQANVKIKFTNAGTGDVIESPAFTARCAGDRYTYTAAMDKATYGIGEIATVTVQFLDSKGNKANSVTAPGASTFTLPMMTTVDYVTTATGVTKADGSVVYKFTVGGTDVAVTAGSYTGIISYSGLTAQAPATLSYKLTTGGDTTSFTDVLRSVVALIASINKQIQALQKLILRR